MHWLAVSHPHNSSPRLFLWSIIWRKDTSLKNCNHNVLSATYSNNLWTNVLYIYRVTLKVGCIEECQQIIEKEYCSLKKMFLTRHRVPEGRWLNLYIYCIPTCSYNYLCYLYLSCVFICIYLCINTYKYTNNYI